eukprot:5966077-Prymnesium_polylepis.1
MWAAAFARTDAPPSCGGARQGCPRRVHVARCCCCICYCSAQRRAESWRQPCAGSAAMWPAAVARPAA